MMARAFELKEDDPLKLQSSVCVSSRKRISLPTIKFFGRKRLEEFRAHGQLSFQNAKLSASLATLNRNQTHDRVFAASDNDLLSQTRLFDKSREIGLSLVDADGFHIS